MSVGRTSRLWAKMRVEEDMRTSSLPFWPKPHLQSQCRQQMKVGHEFQSPGNATCGVSVFSNVRESISGETRQRQPSSGQVFYSSKTFEVSFPRNQVTILALTSKFILNCFSQSTVSIYRPTLSPDRSRSSVNFYFLGTESPFWLPYSSCSQPTCSIA